jgi:DNA-binding beta-propeller fold protein YncE
MPRSSRRKPLVRAGLALFAALVAIAPGAALAAPPALSPSTVGEAPNGAGVFRFVQAVAFSPGGSTIFAGDQYSGIVQAFGRDGSYRFSVGSRAARREPGRLGVVGGVATDRSGHLYVLDSENDRVQVFSASDGHPLSSFGDASIFDLSAGAASIGAGISASGLAVDQRSPSSPPTVYVADQGLNRVVRFTLDLATLLPAGAPAFSDPGLGLLRPQGIALDPGGTRVYVADDQNDRIAVLDPQSLALIGQTGSHGTGPGQFDAPYDVAVDSQQHLYVADNLNNRVDVFDAQSLGFLGVFGGFGRTPGLFSIARGVGGLSDDPLGGVAVADTANNRIQVFAADGTLTAAWGIAGRSAGYFARPRGVAFAPDGGIAVADSFNYRIARIDSDGTFGGQLGLISTFNGYATEGSAAGQFSLPAAVAYDSLGNTVVADTGNDRVVVLGPDGAVLRTTAPGQLADPQALAPGPDPGSVYIADTANSRIVLLRADGTLTPAAAAVTHPAALATGGSRLFVADDTRVLEAIAGAVVAPPPGSAAWDHPDGLAVNPQDGTLYVSELRPGTPNGARVLRGTPTAPGATTYTWDTLATEGPGSREVIQPGGLALSRDGGTLLVADYGNNRVLRFDAPGNAPPRTMTLSVAIDRVSRGTVTSNPLGIACATDCRQQYGAGRQVTLTATPLRGALFAGWTGACASAGAAPACTLTMGSDLAAGASFVEAPVVPPVVAPPPPPPRVTLTNLRIVPSTLQRARKANKRRHLRARKATRATVRVTLSRPATITVTVAIGRKGVKRGSRCIAPPRKRSRNDRACTRFVARTGSRTVKLNGGTGSFRLTPLFAGRTLPAGSYRLNLVALDTDANRVGPVSKPFRVVR